MDEKENFFASPFYSTKPHFLHSLSKREYHDHCLSFNRASQVSLALIRRLGLQRELDAHRGCVNCLQWNASGTLLVSGSDDCHAMLWQPHTGRLCADMQTQHAGNIFSVNLMPLSGDALLATCAADSSVQIHDLTRLQTVKVFNYHTARVKRLATAPDEPHLLWSASEDGTVRQFDLRESHVTSSASGARNVLINLVAATAERHTELKCIAINPLRTEMMAVGASDAFVRVYDRRCLNLRTLSTTEPAAEQAGADRSMIGPEYLAGECDVSAAQYFIAGHLAKPNSVQRRRALSVTYIAFSPNGQELIANIGGEQVYLFNLFEPKEAIRLQLPPSSTTLPPLPQASSSALNAEVDAMRILANSSFEQACYSDAIGLYSVALSLVGYKNVMLLANRAAAFLKRAWDGDNYAALRDCCSALALEPGYVKAHFRLVSALVGLNWLPEAQSALADFAAKYPDETSKSFYQNLDALLSSKLGNGSRSNNSEGEFSPEQVLRHAAQDYSTRYCGHCNTTTDIKEANFFGSNGQFILAGSDDGSFFIWDRQTAILAQVLRGDDSIVNCIQPHPTTCLLATSGIDKVVRLWAPLPQDGTANDRIVTESENAAKANQRRMRHNPLELMLLNMGFRLAHSDEDDEDGGEDGGDQASGEESEFQVPPCRSS